MLTGRRYKLNRRMDCRVKPGNDGNAAAQPSARVLAMALPSEAWGKRQESGTKRKPLRDRGAKPAVESGFSSRSKTKQEKKEGRRNADRRVSYRPRFGAARPSGGARLSAFHHGTCGSERTPPLNSSYALPGTKASSGVTCI
jgi:hypothetical protein